MKKTIFFSFLAVLLSTLAMAQTPHSHALGRKIIFPDVPGFKTLKCDFHIHTVFSDGNVWPTIRVEEALKDGLDAIALTEHLEYQPHSADIPHPDRNRSFAIATDFAKNNDLLVIHGVEITRSMPPGHSNALFVKDANKINVEDPMAAFRAAKEQGAFVFWNHPNWISQRPDGIVTLTDMHKTLIKEGLLHGIEVVNDLTYSDEALQVALENDLTVMGTSDIHGLVDWQFDIPQGGHRPIALVFAKEKTEASIKEALFAGRTVAWFNNLLSGKEDYLNPLIYSSLKVGKLTYSGKSQVAEIEIENLSDANFILENLSPYTFHAHGDVLELKAHSTTTLEVKTVTRLESVELTFRVLNALLAPKKHPVISLMVKG
ncbi:MAG: Sb-PDE family phosphodiesterase [Saprospiraceae bacterium]